MNHLDDDTLLKSQLRLLDDRNEMQVREHLSQCKKCSLRFNQVGNQIKAIGSFEPQIEAEVHPLPQRKSTIVIPLLRAAAFLILGFLAGYFTSELLHPSQVNVVEQHLITRSPVTSISGYTSCEIDRTIVFN
jgi:hypothetical protein